MSRSFFRKITDATVTKSLPCGDDRSRSRTLACAALLASGAAQVALAQTAPPPRPATLETIAVTAARSAQPIADVLADITVIGPEEIARAGAQSLIELLQRQPGVEIFQNGGPGSVSTVLLRGANRGQTLVLIDGIRVASSSAGATSLEAIPLDQIDHIEILRGPASSLYGADAIGGVIQVFTRRGDGAPSANFSAGFGNQGTWDVKGGVGGTSGPIQFAVQAAAKASTGFNAITNPSNFLYVPDRDGYRNQSLSANVGFTVAPEQTLSAQFFRSRLDAQFDGGSTSDERTITITESWQVASRNRITSFWVSRLSAGDGTDDSRTQSDFSSVFKTVQRQYAWQNEFALPVGALTAGYERREERLTTDQGFAVTSRDTDSLFGIYQVRADAHALQANIRHDDSSQFGGKTTGAIAYGYRFAPSFRVTASYGTGFKAPSFNDLYYPFFSNPKLVPETSRNVEGGAYWNGNVGGAAVETKAIVYRNRVSDLIIFQCDANFNCAPNNVNRATLEGVTLGFDARTGNGASLAASVDFQSPQDDGTGNLLPRRARQHGAVTAGYPIGPVRVGVELIASSARYDDAANRVRMSGYAIVNLTAEWALTQGITLFARAANVFDKNYELASGYATGGATIFAGVRALLK